jgi:hypothetical protein
MNKEFIPYEQSLELKQLGFDEPCFGFYTYKGEIRRYTNFDGELNDFQTLKNSSITMGEGWCTALTYQQAFRWFRKMYDLQCWCEPSGSDRYICRYDGNDENGFRWVGYLRNIHNEILYYSNYEEAELACLIKMIEIKKKYI